MRPKRTDAEPDVMDLLRSKRGPGARVVHGTLGARKDWNIRPVKTFPARLVEKGAPAARGAWPAVFRFSRRSMKKAAAPKPPGSPSTGCFLARAAPLVAHLADSRGLTAEIMPNPNACRGNSRNDDAPG